mgnify:CR=1 FL=1
MMASALSFLPRLFEMASRLVLPQSLDYQTNGCELQAANDDKGNGEGFQNEHHCEGWLGGWVSSRKRWELRMMMCVCVLMV